MEQIHIGFVFHKEALHNEMNSISSLHIFSAFLSGEMAEITEYLCMYLVASL